MVSESKITSKQLHLDLFIFGSNNIPTLPSITFIATRIRLHTAKVGLEVEAI